LSAWLDAKQDQACEAAAREGRAANKNELRRHESRDGVAPPKEEAEDAEAAEEAENAAAEERGRRDWERQVAVTRANRAVAAEKLAAEVEPWPEVAAQVLQVSLGQYLAAEEVEAMRRTEQQLAAPDPETRFALEMFGGAEFVYGLSGMMGATGKSDRCLKGTSADCFQVALTEKQLKGQVWPAQDGKVHPAVVQLVRGDVTKAQESSVRDQMLGAKTWKISPALQPKLAQARQKWPATQQALAQLKTQQKTRVQDERAAAQRRCIHDCLAAHVGATRDHCEAKCLP
jgi:hypothetical protein